MEPDSAITQGVRSLSVSGNENAGQTNQPLLKNLIDFREDDGDGQLKFCLLSIVVSNYDERIFGVATVSMILYSTYVKSLNLYEIRYLACKIIYQIL